MLILFIILYFAMTVAVGFYANRKISGEKDFINAGRNLPPALNAFALFALWFGSETLFGASAEFAEHGLRGIIEDPFGGVLCLLIVGLIYSRRMYRLNVLTLGDLFRNQFGPKVELLASVLMVVCFIGYISAQLLALGLVVKVLFAIPLHMSIILSACIVMTYTMAGGMLALSLTDFIQSIMIIIGLLILSYILVDMAGGMGIVMSSIPASHWHFFPDHDAVSWVNWAASWMVLGLGSVVSQDIFQRVNAARSETAAHYSSIAGALLYGIFAFLPMLIIMAIRLVYPHAIGEDMQTALPNIVLQYLPLPVKIIFFGSVISAIMSTASGAILAPASLTSENILKPLFYKDADDRQLLKLTRWCILVLTILAIVIALGSEKIYTLVGMASVFGLVSMFVPFTAALFFDYRNKVGAVASMLLGSLTWFVFEYIYIQEINALVFGLGASILGLAVGKCKINDLEFYK